MWKGENKMKKYVNPALTTEEISVEDVITVDYTVDGDGEEITFDSKDLVYVKLDDADFN